MTWTITPVAVCVPSFVFSVDTSPALDSLLSYDSNTN